MSKHQGEIRADIGRDEDQDEDEGVGEGASQEYDVLLSASSISLAAAVAVAEVALDGPVAAVEASASSKMVLIWMSSSNVAS
jgi:hypothetical protein